MAQQHPANVPQPRRKFSPMGRLVIVAIVLGFLYWLFLSPMKLESRYPKDSLTLDGELSEVQEIALTRLLEESREPITVLAPEGKVQYLRMKINIPDSIAASLQGKAIYFIEQNSDFFQIDNARKNLKFENQDTDDLGITHIQYTQQYKGIPVYGSSIIVDINNNDEIIAFNSNYIPSLNIDVNPKISLNVAKDIVSRNLGIVNTDFSPSTLLMIHYSEIYGTSDANIRLAWFVFSTVNELGNSWLFVIDAHEGHIIQKISDQLEANGEIKLAIYDVTGLETNEEMMKSRIDRLVMRETGPVVSSPPEEAYNAFVNANIIFNYFWNTYNRNSLDNTESGKLIEIFIFTDKLFEKCKKAYWSPKDEIIVLCPAYSQGLDVLAHEYTHGIVSYEYGFQKFGEYITDPEPRALNEAFADIFAAFTDYYENKNEEGAWIISYVGIPNEEEDIVRNLMDPNYNKTIFEPWFPTHYKHIYCSRNDDSCKNKCPVKLDKSDSYHDCGHANSFIFSHATYLAFDNGVSIEKLQYIYYYSLSNRMERKTNMKQAAWVTLEACERLLEDQKHNITEDDCKKINNAFMKVGLIIGPQDSVLLNSKDFLAAIQQWARNYVDEIIDDIQKWIENTKEEISQRIEDWIAEQTEEAKRGIQEWFDALAQQMVQELALWLEQSCCTAIFFPLAIGLGVLGIRKSKNHVMNEPNDRPGKILM